jgi:hypothetical protein
MQGIQKIKFTKIFRFLDKEDCLLKATPQTKSVTIDAGIPIANLWGDVVRIELRDLSTHKLIEYRIKSEEGEWYKPC